MVADLDAVIEAEAGEGPIVLAGHSMGAHTAVSFALGNPDRVAGLIVIGPVYRGEVSGETLAYWDGLANALEGEGIDGFLAYIDSNQPTDPAWRDSVQRFTRERMLQHRHLEAIVQALREVPRSRPFESMEELESLEVPALVVASRDDADPGHPYEVAAAYADRLPRARLISEEEGKSPLAWQGGLLSREVAAFCAVAVVRERLGAS
jgi:pimeloyl-ACP methyl ester carboxylesterase